MALVQPSVIRTIDKVTKDPMPHLVAFFRSRYHDNIFRAESEDDGYTWSIPRPTILPNNNKAVQALTLQSGNIALVFNNNRQASTTSLLRGFCWCPSSIPTDIGCP